MAAGSAGSSRRSFLCPGHIHVAPAPRAEGRSRAHASPRAESRMARSRSPRLCVCVRVCVDLCGGGGVCGCVRACVRRPVWWCCWCVWAVVCVRALKNLAICLCFVDRFLKYLYRSISLSREIQQKGRHHSKAAASIQYHIGTTYNTKLNSNT